MKYILIGFLIITLFSCSSINYANVNSELEKSLLNGVAYSEEGLPLEGVSVTLDNIANTKTDINGRFLFNSLFFGKHSLTFEKDGYTKDTQPFEYKPKLIRKSIFVKVKLFSANYLVREASILIKERKYDKVEKMLKQLEEIDMTDETYLFLKAVYFYNSDKFKESAKILEDLRENNRYNIYFSLTLLKVYEKLKWFRKMAELYLYIGKNNTDQYLNYIKKAAEVYRDFLEDKEEYAKVLKEYDNIKNKNAQ